MARLAICLMVLASLGPFAVEGCPPRPSAGIDDVSDSITKCSGDLTAASVVYTGSASFTVKSVNDATKFPSRIDAGALYVGCDADAIQAAGTNTFNVEIVITADNTCDSDPITFTVTFTDITTTPDPDPEISPTSADVVRDLFEKNGESEIAEFNVTGADNVVALTVGDTDPANIPVSVSPPFTLKLTGSLPSSDVVNVTIEGRDDQNNIVETFYFTLNINDRPYITSPPDGQTFYVCEDFEADDVIFENIQHNSSVSNPVTIIVANQSPSTSSPRFFVNNSATLNVHSAVPEDTFDVDVEGAITQYILTLSISDGTYDSKINVTVEIDDVNDNAPVIDTIGTIGLDQQSPAGSIVYTFNVTDSDRTSPNNEITLSLSGENNNHFVLDGHNLKVADPSPLNYSLVPAYHFVLNATDNATDDEELWTAENFTIQVETRPVFDSYTINMREDISPSATVETLSATDKDNSTILSYEMNSAKTLFDVEGDQIIVVADANQSLYDADTGEKSFIIEISASDEKYTTTANITITVTDVNENAPEFSEDSYTVSINQNTPSGTNVLNTSATDIDATASNSDVKYDLSGTDSGHFEIGIDTGKVTVKSPSHLNFTERSTYTLTVTARDDGDPVQSSTAPVIITLETTPDIIKPDPDEEPTDIPEDTGAGQIVYTMSATDEDGDALTYNLIEVTPAASDLFEVVGDTIKTKQALADNDLDVDANTAERSYNISIRVTDGKYPVDGFVLIDVTDVNDNSPVFDQQVTSYSIPENTTGVVATVTVTDDDYTSPNNQISSYAIVGGDDEQFFDISSTGIISVIKELKAPSYTLTVRATDGGGNPMFTDQDFMFNIEDDIDECVSSPCQNGATCRKNINYYFCECVEGWDGQNCEINLDDCMPNPCQNDGDCSDGVAEHTCNCAAGWKGTINCTEECTGHTYGRNCAEDCSCNTTNVAVSASSQHCNITNGVCNCNNHWTGVDCNEDVSECTQGTDLCTEEFTTCRDTVGGYVCICSTGYNRTNDACQVDNSSSNPFKLPDSVVNSAIERGSTLIYLKVRLDIQCPQLEDPEVYQRLKQEILQQHNTYNIVITIANSLKAEDLTPGSRFTKQLTQNFCEKLKFGLDVVVFNITCSSVDYETFIEATSATDINNLSNKLKEFKENGTLVLDNVVAPVTNLEINGNTVSVTPSVCEIYEAISSCGTSHECTLLSDGKPTCREIEDDNTALILGLGLGLGCGLIFIALCILLGYRCFKPQHHEKRSGRRRSHSRSRSRHSDEYDHKHRVYDNNSYSLETVKPQHQMFDNRPYRYKGGSYLYNGRY